VHKKPAKKFRKRRRVLKWAKTKATSVFRKVSTEDEGNDGDES